ncbi:hypothetical protein C7B80_21830 [Cyanosarcina cf. burmensis CCALA 770]|nr:hypothetical protein C7B80_21830 [Cyanosarcina cf. burmensis CCALA 770]
MYGTIRVGNRSIFLQWLQIYQQQKFSGRLSIISNAGCWQIYLRAGELFWCEGGIDWESKWLRLTTKHCNQDFVRHEEVILPRLNQSNSKYDELITRVEQNILSTDRAAAIVGDCIREIIFEILQQEISNLLSFVFDNCKVSDRLLLATSTPCQYEIEACHDWQQWQQLGLEEVSPNDIPYFLPAMGRWQLREETYHLLKPFVDEKNSLQEIAVRLNWDLHYCAQYFRELEKAGSIAFVERESADRTAKLSARNIAGSHERAIDPQPSTSRKPFPLFSRLVSNCQRFLKPNVSNLVRTSMSNFKSRPKLWLKAGKFSWKAVAFAAGLAILAPLGLTQSSRLQSLSYPLAPVPNKETQKIKIFADTWSGYSTVRNSEFQQELKKQGIEIAYEHEFDQVGRAQRLGAGDADLILTTVDQFVRTQPQGSIVGLIDRSNGADALVLNTKKYPHLRSVDDLGALANRQQGGQQSAIAFTKDSPSEYLGLLLSTKFENFNIANFRQQTTNDAAQAWQMLQDPHQDIAAAILWEPYVTHARKSGYSVVLSSRDVPGAIVDVIVASNRMQQQRPEVLSRFLETYYNRIDAFAVNPSLALNQIALDSKLKNADARAILSGIDFFSATQTHDWMRTGELQSQLQSTASILQLTGNLYQKLPRVGLYVSSFVDRAAAKRQMALERLKQSDPALGDRLSRRTALASSQEKHHSRQIGRLKVRGVVEFAFNSARLSAASQKTLKELANQIKTFDPTLEAKIYGHTSRSGNPTWNRLLSQRRAEAVVAQLKSQGIRLKMRAIGLGSDRLLPGLRADDPKNQRTEVILGT